MKTIQPQPNTSTSYMRHAPVNRARSGLRATAFLTFGKSKTEARQEQKDTLLEFIKPLQRGAAATDVQKDNVEKLASALEKANPTKQSLISPLLNGKWELLYTTSTSILATSRPPFLRPLGPIYQLLDNITLTARNQETTPFFNSVFAELDPVSAIKTKVKFRTFKIFGLIPVTAPESAVGELAVTYLDDDLRISRGDKGNIFILKMVDREAKP